MGRKKYTRFLGTKSRSLGSIWEIGLTPDYVYRKSRVYLKHTDNVPQGTIMYVNEKTNTEYIVQNGKKVFFNSGDKKPDATYVYLGKQGGRYLISEEKVNELIHCPRKHFTGTNPRKSTKARSIARTENLQDLWA